MPFPSPGDFPNPGIEPRSPTLQAVPQDSLVAQMVKSLPAAWETWVPHLGREDPPEKEMATHSTILAWKIPWMDEPGSLQSMRL